MFSLRTSRFVSWACSLGFSNHAQRKHDPVAGVVAANQFDSMPIRPSLPLLLIMCLGLVATIGWFPVAFAWVATQPPPPPPPRMGLLPTRIMTIQHHHEHKYHHQVTTTAMGRRTVEGPLLPEIHPDDQGKKCLVLDLDDTLVHNSFEEEDDSFEEVDDADFVFPVKIKFPDGYVFDDVAHVKKRPGVDLFLEEMAKHYEVVVFTAGHKEYADPILDFLDTKKSIRSRLFQDSCIRDYETDVDVKDLSRLGRDLSQVIIVDDTRYAYRPHPENGINCTKFIDDPNDRELERIAAFLIHVKDVKDVREHCHLWRDWPKGKVDES